MTLIKRALHNFFTSGHSFGDEEALLKFRFRMLNSIMLIVAIFAFIFAMLNDMRVNDIGHIHGTVDYIYSGLTLILFVWLRQSKAHYQKTVIGLMSLSLLAFTSALIFVVHDEFRPIWFYLLIFAAYMAGGIRTGLIFTALSIADIIICHQLFDLQLSELAITSSILGLVIGSAFSLFYTRQINDYNDMLHTKNLELEALATRDYLTGIMNRRNFLETGRRSFETARRHNGRLIFMMLDIDHFKEINDTYGHSIGDNVLVCFADTVSRELRAEDLFGRLGGEEFGIIMTETEECPAEAVAERIRNAVLQMSCHDEGEPFQVTVSIGVALLDAADTHLRELQARADKALYNAKTSGRNRTVVFPAPNGDSARPLSTV